MTTTCVRIALFVLAFAAETCAAAYDANGVALGASEPEVRKAYPSARCKALEWSSAAADRRCDDGRISFGGAQAKITFYLKAGTVQAFDLRFDQQDLERVKAHLRARYGAPFSEVTETIARKDGEERRVFKMRWEKSSDRAVLTAQLERKRATLEVSRGSFETEIYRVR